MKTYGGGVNHTIVVTVTFTPTSTRTTCVC